MSLSIQKIAAIALVLFAAWLFFAGLYFAASFLIPIAFAAVIAMLLWPVGKRLEHWKLSRKLASFFSILLFVIIFIGIIFLLSTQIQQFSDDWPQIQKSFDEKLLQLQQFIKEKFGLGPAEQEKLLEDAKSAEQAGGSMPKRFLTAFLNTLADFLLMLVYTFLFLLYRNHFVQFILKATPEEAKVQSKRLIGETANVAQDYMVGRLSLIIFLAILYSLGLSLIGIQHAIFLGILAALLAIIPYIGNLIGAAFPIALGLMNQGTQAVIWVVVLFSVIQLIENYILEPVVVGKKVNLNPFFTIAIVILGSYIWGIPGMILAIPLLGIGKLILDHSQHFEPVGFLIGSNTDTDTPGFTEKLKNKVKALFR